MTQALYGAFDRFPSSKGAATHIAHAAAALFDRYRGGHLFVLGDPSLPAVQCTARLSGPVTVFRSVWTERSELARTQRHARALAAHLARYRKTLRVVHVRDPWSAVPATVHPERPWKTVFEVNGLPSIELGARYTGIGARTLDRVRALEDHAIRAADIIVTPSHTTRRLLAARGVPEARLFWVPNGAEPPVTVPLRPADAPERYVVYVGAVQPWQGVEDLLRAMSRLRDLDLFLVVVASVREKKCRHLVRFSRRLGIADRVMWKHELPRVEVAQWLAHADASVAPLTRSRRNVEQGCCPLKVLESMAMATPVVGSDLPVVRDLMVHREHGWLVPPERPAALARGLRILHDHPPLAIELGNRAQARVRDHFTWDHSNRLLNQAYDHLERLPRRVPQSRRTP